MQDQHISNVFSFFSICCDNLFGAPYLNVVADQCCDNREPQHVATTMMKVVVWFCENNQPDIIIKDTIPTVAKEYSVKDHCYHNVKIQFWNTTLLQHPFITFHICV